LLFKNLQNFQIALRELNEIQECLQITVFGGASIALQLGKYCFYTGILSSLKSITDDLSRMAPNEFPDFPQELIWLANNVSHNASRTLTGLEITTGMIQAGILNNSSVGQIIYIELNAERTESSKFLDEYIPTVKQVIEDYESGMGSQIKEMKPEQIQVPKPPIFNIEKSNNTNK
jgi:hypothetical protein